MSFSCVVHPGHPRIRRWPFPFVAGLTISNDAEFMAADVAEELFRYVNGTGQSALGVGLGLKLSSSLFFFSDGTTCSVFSGLDKHAAESPWASQAKKLIMDGTIDTNHAFGEFDSEPSFTREHAARVYEWLRFNNLNLPVFTNHGGFNNIQNVGTDALYHRGDQKGIAYHSDLFRSQAVEFLWTDSHTYESFNVPLAFNGEPYVEMRFFPRLVNFLKKKSGLRAQRQRRSPRALLFPIILQDGTSAVGFRRFRGTGDNAPNISSFLGQISRLIESDLYALEGAVVVYQHFGVLRRENGICTPCTVDDLRQNSYGFLTAWRQIKTEVEAGRLWMQKLAPFLRYVRAVESLTVEEFELGFKLVASDGRVTRSDLSGVTIYIQSLDCAAIWFKDQRLKVEENGPDHLGRCSVTVCQEEDGLA